MAKVTLVEKEEEKGVLNWGRFNPGSYLMDQYGRVYVRGTDTLQGLQDPGTESWRGGTGAICNGERLSFRAIAKGSTITIEI